MGVSGEWSVVNGQSNTRSIATAFANDALKLTTHHSPFTIEFWLLNSTFAL